MQSDRSYSTLCPVVHGHIALTINTIQYEINCYHPISATKWVCTPTLFVEHKLFYFYPFVTQTCKTKEAKIFNQNIRLVIICTQRFFLFSDVTSVTKF